MFKKEIIVIIEKLCKIMKIISLAVAFLLFILIIIILSNKDNIYGTVLFPNIITFTIYIGYLIVAFFVNFKAETFFKEINYSSKGEILDKKQSILNWSVILVFFSLIVTGVLGIVYYCFLPNIDED